MTRVAAGSFSEITRRGRVASGFIAKDTRRGRVASGAITKDTRRGEAFPRETHEFTRRFATETACRRYLAGLRWPQGFVCPGCSGGKGWLTARGTLYCASCRRQTSPTAGTLLHGSHVPLRKWFLAMWHACAGESGLVAKGLQRDLALGSYRTAWLIVRKLREAMGRLAGERLRGRVEVGEVLVGRSYEPQGTSPHEAEALPRAATMARGDAGQALVLVAVEIAGRKAAGIRLRHVPDASEEGVAGIVAGCVDRGTHVRSDGWRGYRGLRKVGFRHRVSHAAEDEEPGADLLPRVRPVVLKLRRWLAAVYRARACHKHLQGYLDEFVFRWDGRRSRSVAKAFRRLAEEIVRQRVARGIRAPDGRGRPEERVPPSR